MEDGDVTTNGVANSLDEALTYALQLARESLTEAEAKLPNAWVASMLVTPRSSST